MPQMLRGEEWEDGKGIEIHLAIAAVMDFNQTEGRWPGIHSKDDALKVVEIAKRISEERKEKEGACWSQAVSFAFPSGEARDLDEKRIERFSRLFCTELTGLCAFLGGAAAQEVLKKSGKFTPIDQWVHHDEPILVADECPSNVGPLFGSRYDHQIAILGKDFQAKAANQRVFLVGCGALGCEYLKGLALMGIGTGRDGQVYVTDMDRIEVSNLSRQFLFRQHDVGNPKSVSGAQSRKEDESSDEYRSTRAQGRKPTLRTFSTTNSGSRLMFAGTLSTMFMLAGTLMHVVSTIPSRCSKVARLVQSAIQKLFYPFARRRTTMARNLTITRTRLPCAP